VARAFDGTDDVVDCGTIAGLNGSSAASYSAWIYRGSTGETVGFGGSAGISNNRFSSIWFSDGNFYTSAEADSLAYGYCALAGIGWHHVGVVYDGTQTGDANRLRVFVDGVQQSLTFSGVAIPASLGNVNPWTFGKDSSTRFCGGRVAEAALWMAALNGNEMAAFARARSPHSIRAADRKGYWPLWGDHSPEINLAGATNQGTITGTTKASHAPVVPFMMEWWPNVLAGVVNAPPYLAGNVMALSRQRRFSRRM
jgi:Concanavalin A-like lectin/glucanases superfamily